MRIKSILLGLACSVFIFNSCKTDDVDPPIDSTISYASLSLDKFTISENGGAAIISATLSVASSENVEINLVYTGTATFTDDYTVSTSISIPAGQLNGSATISAVQDELEEGKETITIEVGSITGAKEEETQRLICTIEDDDVPFEIELLINEILYDPSNSGLDGDANGDGVYVHAEDEFVEIINLSSQAIDLSGFILYDDENLASKTPNHTFPANTILESGKAIVVFGGGSPKGTFGGAVVQTSTSGDLNLNNAGDVLYIYNTENKEMLKIDIEPFSNNPNESYTRNPDLTGEFEQHSANTALLFSPGTKMDGTSF